MDRNELMEQLREKLDKNIADMQKEWYALSPSLVAGKAQEIEATRVTYNELYSGWAYMDDKIEYLLRFENPLEVVRDKWIEEQCLPDVSEEMNHVLWSIMDTPDAEHEYDLDPKYMAENEPGNGMKMQ